MSLKINIDTNFTHLDDLMDDLGEKDLVNAARSALNSATRRAREQGSKRLSMRVNLKRSEIKKRIVYKKARGGSLKSLEASLTFSGIPISMINFIVGSKKPIDQKGKQVKKRRKLKARVKGSKKILLQGAFIQKIQSKHVFRHKGAGRRARKLSTKSLAKIVLEDRSQKIFDEIVEKRFKREFEKQIRWRWGKSYQRFNGKKLKKLR